jgi:hypothetical protein
MCRDCLELVDDAALTARREAMRTRPWDFPFLEQPTTADEHDRRICFYSTRVVHEPRRTLEQTVRMVTRPSLEPPPVAGTLVRDPHGTEMVVVGALGQLFLAVGRGNAYFLNFVAAIPSPPRTVGPMPWLDTGAMGALIERFVPGYGHLTDEAAFHAATARLLKELARALHINIRSSIGRIRRLLETTAGVGRVVAAWSAIRRLPAVVDLHENLGDWSGWAESRAEPRAEPPAEPRADPPAASPTESARLARALADQTAQHEACRSELREALAALQRSRDECAELRAAKRPCVDRPAAVWRLDWLARRESLD